MTKAIKNALKKLLTEKIYCNYLLKDVVVKGVSHVENGDWFRMWVDENNDDTGTCRYDTYQKLIETGLVKVVKNKAHVNDESETMTLNEKGLLYAKSL